MTRNRLMGSLTFPLADFGIVAPDVGGFIVSIADEGTLEFLVVFAKAEGPGRPAEAGPRGARSARTAGG